MNCLLAYLGRGKSCTQYDIGKYGRNDYKRNEDDCRFKTSKGMFICIEFEHLTTTRKRRRSRAGSNLGNSYCECIQPGNKNMPVRKRFDDGASMLTIIGYYDKYACGNARKYSPNPR